MIGEALGNYRVTAKVGEGGMGAVYLAVHPLIGRRAAVKVLLPEYSNQPDAVNRFFREAQLTASLKHPALIDVFDYGTHASGCAYIVMDYLEGETLQQRLHRERLDISAAIDIARQIAVGISVAHAASIVHRDLKPGNIFLTLASTNSEKEVVKILDFGIAKLANRAAACGDGTRADIILGTPAYMAPEQCRGAGGVDLRADIYSLGCILYEMLCCHPPFVYQSAGELIAAHLYEPPQPIRRHDPSMPEKLERIVSRALAKNPDERFQSMAEFTAALEQIGPHVPTKQDCTAGPDAHAVETRRNTETALGRESADRTATFSAWRDLAVRPAAKVLPAGVSFEGKVAPFPNDVEIHKDTNASTLSRGASVRQFVGALPNSKRSAWTILVALAAIAGVGMYLGKWQGISASAVRPAGTVVPSSSSKPTVSAWDNASTIDEDLFPRNQTGQDASHPAPRAEASAASPRFRAAQPSSLRNVAANSGETSSEVSKERAEEPCFPACREGYSCAMGRCVRPKPQLGASSPLSSARAVAQATCFPACRAGYICDSGACIPEKGARTGAAR